MPHRIVVVKELAQLLGGLAHPQRIRIIQELREGERDVNSLQAALGISHSGVSQHLSVLRLHRLVTERREGRRVFYHLTQPELARWLVEGMQFLEVLQAATRDLQKAVAIVRDEWRSPTQ